MTSDHSFWDAQQPAPAEASDGLVPNAATAVQRDFSLEGLVGLGDDVVISWIDGARIVAEGESISGKDSVKAAGAQVDQASGTLDFQEDPITLPMILAISGALLLLVVVKLCLRFRKKMARGCEDLALTSVPPSSEKVRDPLQGSAVFYKLQQSVTKFPVKSPIEDFSVDVVLEQTPSLANQQLADLKSPKRIKSPKRTSSGSRKKSSQCKASLRKKDKNEKESTETVDGP